MNFNFPQLYFMVFSALQLLFFLVSFLPDFVLAGDNCSHIVRETGKIAAKDFAMISQKAGFSSLQHYTSIQNVIEIIESGRMELPKNLPKEQIRSFNYTPDLIMFYLEKGLLPISEGHYNRGMSNANYLLPQKFPHRDSVFTNLDMAYLRYSLQAMNGRDFHISQNYQAYGEYSPGEDFRSTNRSLGLNTFYKRGKIGECGFYESIPNDYLLEIWVSPVQRDAMIASFHQKGIFEVNGQPIEKFVKSPSDSAFQYIETSTINLPSNYMAFKRDYRWVIVPKGDP